MRAKSFNVLFVNTKQLRKVAFRHTYIFWTVYIWDYLGSGLLYFNQVYSILNFCKFGSLNSKAFLLYIIDITYLAPQLGTIHE